jgi:hypothetical protein
LTTTMKRAATAQRTPRKRPPRSAQDGEKLKAGIHVLDLVAREKPEKGTGPAHLPKIEITRPEG